MAMVVAQKEIDYTIKPEAVTPAVDTSSWPLLLKNYNNCMNKLQLLEEQN
jgi:H/ACA ribonucleoprotein complex subunit 4